MSSSAVILPYWHSTIRLFPDRRVRLYAGVRVPQPDLSILNGALQLHATLREPRERLTGGSIDIDNRQISETIKLVAHLLPPEFRAVAAVTKDIDLPGATTGLAYAFLVRLADIDPDLDLPGQITLPQIGLVIGTEAPGEHQGLVGMPAEGQHTDQHAFIGFGGMACERQRMAAVVVAVHVSYLHVGLEDGCLEGHVW